jgi:hypothetical protein
MARASSLRSRELQLARASDFKEPGQSDLGHDPERASSLEASVLGAAGAAGAARLEFLSRQRCWTLARATVFHGSLEKVATFALGRRPQGYRDTGASAVGDLRPRAPDLKGRRFGCSAGFEKSSAALPQHTATAPHEMNPAQSPTLLNSRDGWRRFGCSAGFAQPWVHLLPSLLRALARPQRLSPATEISSRRSLRSRLGPLRAKLAALRGSARGPAGRRHLAAIPLPCDVKIATIPTMGLISKLCYLLPRFVNLPED